MKYLLYFIFFISTFILINCKPSETHPSSAKEIKTTLGKPTIQPKQCKYISDYYAKGETLNYNGYEVAKLHKKVNFREMAGSVENSYAVIRRNGRQLAEFGGLYHALGNTVDFGLFSLLASEEQQLIISQTIPRSGRHWIVSLLPKLDMIFDSGEYKLGTEDFTVMDIDGDGVYEISLPLTAFWGFSSMSMAESPLPNIIFKYDIAAKKYLPANHLFQYEAPGNVEEEAKKIDPNKEAHYLSDRLEILLRYIYIGREKEGWTFFNATYLRGDKEGVKTKIASVLKREPIYKYIYGK